MATSTCPPWLLNSQHLWTTASLTDRGLSDRQIARFVRCGDLVRIRRGCYRAGRFWRKLSADSQALQLLYAHHHAVLPATSGGMVYSHTSAARVLGLHLWSVDEAIHVTQAFPTSRDGHASDVRGHYSVLLPHEITTRKNLPITSLERTAVDCARVLAYKQALIVADHALRVGADRDRMLEIVQRLAGHKGIGNARKITMRASRLSESPGETLTRHFIERMRLPIPDQQVIVRTRHGDHRLDFAWRDLLLALEFDGKIKYFDYAPTKDVLFEERRREKALQEIGWQFIRIEWKDLFRETELKARLLKALSRAQHARQTRETPQKSA